MTRGLLALVVSLTVLAGCGDAPATGGPSADDPTGSPPSSFAFGRCPSDAPALEAARPVAEADLDGDGTAASIGLVPPSVGGPCANALIAESGREVSGVPLGETVLDPGAADVVQLQGTPRQLVVVRGEAHPRGGFSLHLYGDDEGRLGEILEDGEPFLDFVASDGGAAPATVSCTEDGGIATVTTLTHKPPGIVLAWDVTTTNYQLTGTRARVVSTSTERGIADPTLQQQMPALFDPEAYFVDCIV